MENNISKRQYKRAVIINDMSCYGKCSLTVSLPLISAQGIEAVPIPTAILSNHTGGFSAFTVLDMTEEMKKIVEEDLPITRRVVSNEEAAEIYKKYHLTDKINICLLGAYPQNFVSYICGETLATFVELSEEECDMSLETDGVTVRIKK